MSSEESGEVVIKSASYECWQGRLLDEDVVTSLIDKFLCFYTEIMQDI